MIAVPLLGFHYPDVNLVEAQFAVQMISGSARLKVCRQALTLGKYYAILDQYCACAAPLVVLVDAQDIEYYTNVNFCLCNLLLQFGWVAQCGDMAVVKESNSTYTDKAYRPRYSP